MEYRDRTFDGETILLDGSTFVGCTFNHRCELVFHGIEPVSMDANRISQDTIWRFEGPAKRTIRFMQFLHHNGMRDVVETTIADIRSGDLPSGPQP